MFHRLGHCPGWWRWRMSAVSASPDHMILYALETFKKKSSHKFVLRLTNFPCLNPFPNCQICTSMIMKKVSHCSFPSNPNWKCKAIFLPSLNAFISDHALEKWKRRKPSRKNPAISLSYVWQTISLSLPFWNLSNMYFNDYEKGWPLCCPFKPYLKVQINISGIFEWFYIRSWSKITFAISHRPLGNIS